MKLLLLTLLLPVCALADAPVAIDANYPGGNVLVQSIDGDTAYLAPDLRDTSTWWFYWNFRLRAPVGRPVKIVFTEKNPIGVRGPAMSIDGGFSWRWMGAEAVTPFQNGTKLAWSFQASVPAGASEVRYAFCIPHLQADLDAFLARHRDHPRLRREELCKSRQGRSVELLRAGCLEKPEAYVVVTSRHHCCETMGTYALEGMVEAALAESGPWRDRWQLIAVPHMDKDGVVAGDQGKNRKPHDHNRDYNAEPLYPEVAAVMKFGETLKGRVLAMLDLHCPYIRGEWNDRAYFVGPESDKFWEATVGFASVLEKVQQGPIHFRARDCLKFGTGWNTSANYSQGRNSSAWGRDAFPDARLVSGLEIAYADALGDEVNAESARALGRDLGRALVAAYAETPKP